MPGVLIELKSEKDCSENELKELAEIALAQIEERQYDMELCENNVEKIIKYGVAFSGKNVQIVMKS